MNFCFILQSKPFRNKIAITFALLLHERALKEPLIQLSIVSLYRTWNAFLEEKLYFHFVFYTMQLLNVVFQLLKPLTFKDNILKSQEPIVIRPQ